MHVALTLPNTVMSRGYYYWSLSNCSIAPQNTKNPGGDMMVCFESHFKMPQHSTAQHSTLRQTAPGCCIRTDHGAEDLLASPQLNRLHNGGHRQIIALSCIPHVCAQKPKLAPAVEAVLGSHQKGRRQKVLHSMVSWSKSTYRHHTNHQAVDLSGILWCLLSI